MSEETYSFLCPSCSAHLSVPVSVAGVSGPCPYCASTITSPMPDQVPAEDLVAIREAMAEEAAQAQLQEQQQPADPVDYGLPPLSDPPPAPAPAAVAPSVAEQPWNAPAPAAEVEMVTTEPPATESPRRSGRKKRGERVPKGKGKGKQKQRSGEQQSRPARREEAAPRSSKSKKSAATVVDSPPDNGLSLFAKVSLGVAGIALVALGAVYGLPALLGDKGEDNKDPAGPMEQTLQTAGMSPGVNSDATLPNVARNVDSGASSPTRNAPKPDELIVPVARTENEPRPGLPEPPSSAPPTGSTSTTLPASMTTYTPAPDSILVKPRQALDSFLAARNWKERIKYVTGGQSLASEMRAYYTQYPDGPLDPVSVNWTLNEKEEDGKSEIFVFTTSFDVQDGDRLIYLDFPTVVEARNGKYTVNWRSFVEFKDRHLHQFITKRAFNKPQKFHVIALRAHYFDGDTELKEKMKTGEFVCVKISSPNPEDSTKAFLNTGNTNGKKMAAGLLWQKAAGGHFDTPLVELCWKKTSSKTPYIEITDVLGDKWRDTPK